MEIVQIYYMTCDVTLDYFGIKIMFQWKCLKVLNLTIFDLEGDLLS